MSLNYTHTVRKVGFGKDKVEANIETCRRSDTVSSSELVHQLHLQTMLQPGVINAVIDALVDSVETYFRNGHAVYIGRSGKDGDGLGILYPRLVRTKQQAEGKEDPVTLLSVGVGLMPSTRMKQMLATISVRNVTEKEEAANDKAEEDTTPTPPAGDGSSKPGSSGSDIEQGNQPQPGGNSGGGGGGDDNDRFE